MNKFIKLCVILMILQTVQKTSAQQVITSSGNYYTNSQGSLSVTVGEAVVNTVNNTSINLILTQGFQQSTIQSIVPLKLIVFTGNKIGNDIKLQWKVLNELNIQTYTIQRSTNGTTFENIGIVNAINNGSKENDYSFLDTKANNTTVYYKLLINEKNGVTQHSWIVSLTNKVVDQIKVYPVPVKNAVTIQFTQAEIKTQNIQITEVNGKVVYNKMHILSIGNNALNIDMSSFAAGTYFLIGLNETGIKIIKQ